MSDWMSHWKLRRDPFLGGATPYVALCSHEEAVARLVHAGETGQPFASLRGARGSGKSRVLDRALEELSSPSRRCVRVSGSAADGDLLAEVAQSFGIRPSAGAGRTALWRALRDAARICRWQSLHLVVGIDDADHLSDGAERKDVARLAHLDAHPAARVTVLRTVCHGDDEPADLWELSIQLRGATRSEAERYVVAKLAAAGREDPTFTPRALSRLHALAEGLPRGLDRLGSLALMAGALRRLEIVTPEVVDAVALECTWLGAA